MWLRYGVGGDSTLVAIEDVSSGKTDLLCPYCEGGLTAKKGRIKAHHFAHTKETCHTVIERQDADAPVLPLYDNFNIQLSGRELEELKQLWRRYGIKNRTCGPVSQSLVRAGLLEWNDYRQGYEFTKSGKIPIGELSLMLFNQIQEPLILEKLETFELSARRAFLESAPDLPDRLTDLRLYRAQLKRILSCALYFLEIHADGATLHKIGVTRRPIEERTKEVERELLSHFKTVAVDVLGVWPHRGNVELYFKHRYEFNNHPIGSLSEYYKFDAPEDVKAALRDLRRMKPKALCQDEKDILEDKPSLVEQVIQAEQKALLRSDAIRVGMERAARGGVRIGRPKVAESDEEFLAKPSSQRIIEALKMGLSLRQASRQAGVSVNTVRKVKAVLQILS